jgi:hypothetical protein
MFSLLKNFSSQVLYKLVPMSSCLKISVKLQVAYPTHEQIKYVQSSIKSTQVWNFIKNSSLWTNPLLANPIDWNQLSLKLWLQINYVLETSWKYLNNHVWWCCVRMYLCVLLILLMVDCLHGIMRMGVPIMWRWWVMLTCYCGPWIIHHPQRCMWYWPCKMVHSRMWYIHYMLGSMTSWWLTFSYTFFPLFISKVVTTLIVTIQMLYNKNNGYKNK